MIFLNPYVNARASDGYHEGSTMAVASDGFLSVYGTIGPVSRFDVLRNRMRITRVVRRRTPITRVLRRKVEG